MASKCPTCRGVVSGEGPNRPFCSERCQRIDLGKWLNEEYRISRPMTPTELIAMVESEQPDDGGAQGDA